MKAGRARVGMVPDEAAPVSGEVSMWRKVIAQVITDATMPCNERRGSERKRIRDESRQWLIEPSADFEEVCGLAGVPSEATRAFALKQIMEADQRQQDGTQRGRAGRRGTPMRPRKLYEHDSISLTLTQWADRVGLNPTTLASRLADGWSIADALTTPTQPHFGRRRRGVGSDFSEKAGDRRGEARATSDLNGDLECR